MFKKITIILAALAAVVLALPHHGMNHHNHGLHQGRPSSFSEESHFGLGNQGQFHPGFHPQNPKPNPETPVDPETPADPETPVDPETPADPETPVDPETPADPETPVDPETPEDEILDLDNVPSVVPQTRFCNLTASLAGAPTTNPALTFIPFICLILG